MSVIQFSNFEMIRFLIFSVNFFRFGRASIEREGEKEEKYILIRKSLKKELATNMEFLNTEHFNLSKDR